MWGMYQVPEWGTRFHPWRPSKEVCLGWQFYNFKLVSSFVDTTQENPDPKKVPGAACTSNLLLVAWPFFVMDPNDCSYRYRYCCTVYCSNNCLISQTRRSFPLPHDNSPNPNSNLCNWHNIIQYEWSDLNGFTGTVLTTRFFEDRQPSSTKLEVCKRIPTRSTRKTTPLLQLKNWIHHGMLLFLRQRRRLRQLKVRDRNEQPGWEGRWWEAALRC